MPNLRTIEGDPRSTDIYKQIRSISSGAPVVDVFNRIADRESYAMRSLAKRDPLKSLGLVSRAVETYEALMLLRHIPQELLARVSNDLFPQAPVDHLERSQRALLVGLAGREETFEGACMQIYTARQSQDGIVDEDSMLSLATIEHGWKKHKLEIKGHAKIVLVPRVERLRIPKEFGREAKVINDIVDSFVDEAAQFQRNTKREDRVKDLTPGYIAERAFRRIWDLST